jgi:lipopolysaccharide/colanic/teichoic acid biosynthesis glycosyltransferase
MPVSPISADRAGSFVHPSYNLVKDAVVAEVSAPGGLRLGATHLGDDPLYHVGKRCVDLVLASALLVLLLPVLLLIALAIKVETPGSVIFTQERVGGRFVGRPGRRVWTIAPFTLFKFRSMKMNADVDLHRRYMTAYLTADETGLSLLRPGRREGDSYRPLSDPRVTRVGRFLRSLSLDELPQLWNVIRGDMSLVGPRPPMPYEVDLYEDRHLARLSSLPGITGWAQIKGRTSIGFEDMVRLDTEYLTRRSLLFDIKILFLTIPMVLSRKAAD